MTGRQGFAVWITGIPASGKSTVTRELSLLLGERGVPTVVLESDALRRILTPTPSFSPDERDRFYQALISIGDVITRNGVNVIFDATANKRSYRDQARSLIPKFLEVYVFCPLDVCMRRDPKGIYRRAQEGSAETVPGFQAAYEPPDNPEVNLDGQGSPTAGAEVVLNALEQRHYI